LAISLDFDFVFGNEGQTCGHAGLKEHVLGHSKRNKKIGKYKELSVDYGRNCYSLKIAGELEEFAIKANCEGYAGSFRLLTGGLRRLRGRKVTAARFNR